MVEQVASDVLAIRIKGTYGYEIISIIRWNYNNTLFVALAVLGDELKSPYGIYGCCAAGVIKVIAAMCTDPDATVM